MRKVKALLEVTKLVKDRKAFQIWLMNASAWKGKEEEDCAPPNFSYALNFIIGEVD
jgi:hypothetical protein